MTCTFEVRRSEVVSCYRYNAQVNLCYPVLLRRASFGSVPTSTSFKPNWMLYNLIMAFFNNSDILVDR